MILTLILLNICHLLADFTPLSTAWMLKAKRFGKPLLPILCHALVHAILMGYVLVIIQAKSVIILMLIQAITHFIIDVLKGRLNNIFPVVSNPSNTIHWVVFGTDQFLHQMVIIIMAYYANV